jgi:predicted AlkP superfamily phosphohydrolase/phosphomutase
MKGRERHGIVDPKDADALLNEIAKKLLQTTDPANQQQVVTRVDMAANVYHGPYARSGPDAIIGFTRGYRASMRTIFGDIPAEVFEENTSVWSGDHSNDYTQVPGVLLSNKKITAEAPALTDIAPTILSEFGIETPSQMRGRSVFAGEAIPTTAIQARTSPGR